MRRQIPTVQTSAWDTLQVKQGRVSVSSAGLWVWSSTATMSDVGPKLVLQQKKFQVSYQPVLATAFVKYTWLHKVLSFTSIRPLYYYFYCHKMHFYMWIWFCTYMNYFKRKTERHLIVDYHYLLFLYYYFLWKKCIYIIFFLREE